MLSLPASVAPAPQAQGACYTDRRGTIPNRTSLLQRPPEVEDRVIPGHWEGDLIRGARNASAIGTPGERRPLFVTLARMDNASTEAAAVTGFCTVPNRIDAQRRRALIYDQGREMAQHACFSELTGVKISFADPHRALGSAASTRIPMACYASLSQRAPICPVSLGSNPMPLLGNRIRDHAKASAGIAPPNSSCPISTSPDSFINSLHFGLETTPPFSGAFSNGCHLLRRSEDSLQVLHLLAHLFDEQFELDCCLRDFRYQ
ncbi:MAG: IS30 family transposase [Candidatus Accumulibacter sp.]|nr:IS30 family transposase [Accumulibacter sp.]